MKKITLLFLALTAMLNVANAQTTLYSENFESNVSTANGNYTFAPSTKYGTWSGGVDLVTAGDADINLRKGWGEQFLLKILSTGAAVTIPNIPVAGHTNLNLSYVFVVEGGGAAEVPNIEASVDGGTNWVTLSTVASGGGNWNQTMSVALPTGTYNAISLRMNPPANGLGHLFDNFAITDTPPLIYSENFESNVSTSNSNYTFAPPTKYGTWSGGVDLVTAGDADINLRKGWGEQFLLKILSTGAAVTIPNIPVAGLTNLNLSYVFVVEGGGAAEVPNIEASVDGGTNWVTLSTVASGGGNWNQTMSVALPTGTYNAISLRMNPPANGLGHLFDNFVITGSLASTTWNGTAWSNGIPFATVEAIIDGTYSTTTNGAFTTKKLTVNATGSLTINSGTNVRVQNEVINNGTFLVQNNANLIQVNNTTNTGAITVNRNSNTLSRLDYTLWSSPVASQNLAAFSPLTSQSPNRFYTYTTATNVYAETANPTSTNFTPGAGYLIRMPNTAVTAPATETFNGQFTGVPNNGNVSFTLSTAGSGFNLVGNPYPSPITMATLVENNSTVISSTLYFWRGTNGAGTAYCTYNTTGSIFTTNGNAQSVNPAGIIQTGQGFFVQAIGAGSLAFKNSQRLINTAGQFFKTKQVATPSRIWLNATNAAGDFSQMAVNYTDGATQGVDNFDGKYINDSPLALTSNINNEEYTIQGRPAFDASDIVPLNFKTPSAGDYTIAIDHADGVFANGQDVVLVDNTTGTETSLTNSSYTFTAAAGTANSRFTLKYQKTLGTNNSVLGDNNVTVYRNKGTLYVNAGDATIANIKVYDVQGRLVAELKNVKATSATIANLKATNQVLVVKITSQDNKVVTKKVVN